MEEKAIQLFQKNNIVFIATMMKNGATQVSPVWTNYDSGYILVNTADGRVKHKNILRDTRVALSVVSNDNSLEMTTIRGTVEEIIPDYNYAHVDKSASQYLGQKHYLFKKDNEKRIIFKIKPEHVFVMPDLKMNST